MLATAAKTVLAASSARPSTVVRQRRHVACSVKLPRASARRVGGAVRGARLACYAKLGIVGGSNLNDSELFEHLEKKVVETEYGNVVVYDSPPDAEKQICFVKRHYCGEDETYVPPHLVKAPAFLKVRVVRHSHTRERTQRTPTLQEHRRGKKASDDVSLLCVTSVFYFSLPLSPIPPSSPPRFLRILLPQAFKKIGVTEVLQVCCVGSLVKGHNPPHSIIFPDDYIALWNTATYATNDKSGELLPKLEASSRSTALAAVQATDIPLRMKLVECGATYVQTRGPRFETKAEIRALGIMGGDVVGMTGVSEIVLCNELRMPVSMVCFCDNYANGISTEIDAYNEFYSNIKSNVENVEETVRVIIDALLEKQKTRSSETSNNDVGEHQKKTAEAQATR